MDQAGKQKQQSVLVIDSGVGGLSVLALAEKRMPEENFSFFADAAFAPYGDRQPDEIIARLHEILRLHSDPAPKALLLACNTATSAAAAVLRNELSIPVIGMEPALKPAVLNTAGRVIVIATKLTIREEKFQKLLSKYGEGRDIIPLACPGLMEIVEKDPEGPEAEYYLREHLAPYAETAEGIVLGCTHYVFLRPLIKRIFPALRIFDGNDGVVRHLHEILSQQENPGGEGSLSIDCSLSEPESRRVYLQKCNKMLQFCSSLYDKAGMS